MDRSQRPEGVTSTNFTCVLTVTYTLKILLICLNITRFITWPSCDNRSGGPDNGWNRLTRTNFCELVLCDKKEISSKISNQSSLAGTLLFGTVSDLYTREIWAHNSFWSPRNVHLKSDLLADLLTMVFWVRCKIYDPPSSPHLLYNRTWQYMTEHGPTINSRTWQNIAIQQLISKYDRIWSNN